MTMKKTLLLSLLAFLLCIPAGAQYFDHLAVGVGAGTEGIGLELAAPLGKYVEVKAGYGTAVGLVGIKLQDVSVPEHPGNASSNNVSVPLTVRLGMSDARLLFSFFPFSDADFHLTAGAYMGSPRFLRGILDGMPEAYNTVGLDVDGYLVKAHSNVLEAQVCAPGIGGENFAVKPYLGIGYGRALKGDRRIGYSVNLGALYQGKPGLWADGEGITGRVKRVPLSGLSALDSAEKYLSYATFWPVLNFHLYIRLF